MRFASLCFSSNSRSQPTLTGFFADRWFGAGLLSQQKERKTKSEKTSDSTKGFPVGSTLVPNHPNPCNYFHMSEWRACIWHQMGQTREGSFRGMDDPGRASAVPAKRDAWKPFWGNNDPNCLLVLRLVLCKESPFLSFEKTFALKHRKRSNKKKRKGSESNRNNKRSFNE